MYIKRSVGLLLTAFLILDRRATTLAATTDGSTTNQSSPWPGRPTNTSAMDEPAFRLSRQGERTKVRDTHKAIHPSPHFSISLSLSRPGVGSETAGSGPTGDLAEAREIGWLGVCWKVNLSSLPSISGCGSSLFLSFSVWFDGGSWKGGRLAENRPGVSLAGSPSPLSLFLAHLHTHIHSLTRIRTHTPSFRLSGVAGSMDRGYAGISGSGHHSA